LTAKKDLLEQSNAKDRLDIELMSIEIDESDESDEEDEENGASTKTGTTVKVESHLETPPGLNVFKRSDGDGSFGFNIFNMDSLDLERDFGYTRRGKLKGHGYTDQELDRIFSDKIVFLRHLMPEAQSVLLCDKDDFKAIMEFLFYSMSVCTNRRLSEALANAMFDLCKNYGFTWRLDISHIVTVLTNYGIHPGFVRSSWFSGILKDYRNAAANCKFRRGKSDYKFNLPLVSKKSKNYRRTKLDDEKFKLIVTQFVLFVTEFCNGVNKLDLRYQGDCSDMCIFLFLFIKLGTAEQFVMDYRVNEAISTMLIYLLDTIPARYWWCGPTTKKKPENESFTFEKYSFPRCLSEMIHKFIPAEIDTNIQNWTSDQNSVLQGHVYLDDHHLNIIHKLELIPPSYRGNQLKRFLAFYYLQTTLMIGKVACPLNPDIRDVATPHVLDATGLKVLWYKEAPNFPKLLLVVKLCDILVGYETGEAFPPEKVSAIKKVHARLLEKLQKQFPSMQSAQKLKVAVPMAKLKNHVQIVSERWEQGCSETESRT